jgi:hypothetical protein
MFSVLGLKKTLPRSPSMPEALPFLKLFIASSILFDVITAFKA